MVIDIIFLIFAGWGFYLGFSRGIIKTVFTAFSYVFGIMAAFKLGPPATLFLEQTFGDDHPFMFIAGFLLAFVLTMFFIRIIANALEGLLQTANINIINKFAGGVLLGALMTLMYSVLLWFGAKSHLLKQEDIGNSRTYVYLEHFPTQMKGVYETIKPTFQDFWDDSVEFMDRLEERSIEKSDSETSIFDLPDEESDTAKEQE